MTFLLSLLVGFHFHLPVTGGGDVAIGVSKPWAAVLPASRMWYPDTETGCHRGISAVQKRSVSDTMRIDGRGGKMYSFCACSLGA